MDLVKKAVLIIFMFIPFFITALLGFFSLYLLLQPILFLNFNIELFVFCRGVAFSLSLIVPMTSCYFLCFLNHKVKANFILFSLTMLSLVFWVYKSLNRHALEYEFLEGAQCLVCL